MRVPNLANVLVGLGLLLLLTTFWMPTWSGRRAARAEDRAFEVTVELLRSGLRHAPLDLDDPVAIRAVLTELRRRCAARGQPSSDLPELVAAPPEAPLVFGNRHYLFRLARRPEPVRKPLDWDPRARRSLEAYGWPRVLLPPGRTAFYAPEQGRVAFTRNLGARYHGFDRMPESGAGVPRESGTYTLRDEDYRSARDERWLVIPARATWPPAE